MQIILSLLKSNAFFHNSNVKVLLILQILLWFWLSNTSRASALSKDLSSLSCRCASSSDVLFPCGLDDGFFQICPLPDTVPGLVQRQGLQDMVREQDMGLKRVLQETDMEPGLVKASEKALDRGREQEMEQEMALEMVLEMVLAMVLEMVLEMELERVLEKVLD